MQENLTSIRFIQIKPNTTGREKLILNTHKKTQKKTHEQKLN
jgi:hypothetical protein